MSRYMTRCMHCTQVGQQLGYITVNNMCFAWGLGWVEAGVARPPPQQVHCSRSSSSHQIIGGGGGHSSLDLIPRNLISKLTFLTMGFNP